MHQDDSTSGTEQPATDKSKFGTEPNFKEALEEA